MMKRNYKRIVSALLAATMVLGLIPGGVSAQMSTEKISISELKVNNLIAPLGIDTVPRFRWLNSSAGYGKYQSAYQIVVSSTAQKAASHEGDLWDSGKVAREDNFDIPYTGKALSSRSLYYWSVRVWDEADNASAWSEVARFGTGVLDPADWKGNWIGSQDYDPFQLSDFTLTGANWIWYCNGVNISSTPSNTIEYFRKHITVNKTVEKAYLAASCDDYFTLYVNGNQMMDVPYKANGWKEGQLTEISQWLTAGDNVIAIKAINKSKRAGLLAKLVISYTDGTWESISTDKTWLASQTEQAGWQEKNFADTAWVTADYALAYGEKPYYEDVALPIPAAKNYDFDLSDANWVWYTDGTSISKTPATTEYFRKGITIDESKTVEKAYVAASADDYFSFYINGEKATSINYAASGWTVGRFQEVTDLVHTGENILAAECSNYATGRAAFIGKLVVYYTDGTADTWITDDSWKASNEKTAAWNTKGFDDTAWAAVDYLLPYGTSPYDAGVQLTFEKRVQKDITDNSAPMLRKTFALDKEITSARIYMAGLGVFTLAVNGIDPTGSVLNQTESVYSKTLSYQVYDVTNMLQSGKNALAVELGNGFYNCPDNASLHWAEAPWCSDPKLMLELVIEYADGTTQTIVSDESWKAYSQGPMLRDSMFAGEIYDARNEVSGWEETAFDDSGWRNAKALEAPEGILTFAELEPMRKLESSKPTSVKKLENGNYLVTFPKQTTGWARIAFPEAAAGDKITITYTEKAHENGVVAYVVQDYLLQQYTYICKGENDVHEPKFSYVGFGYAEIEGYTGNLTVEDITAYQIATDVEHTGSFESGNETVNQLHEIMVRTMVNNMQGKPTDTPVYEKIGWTGDYNAGMKCFNYNFDTANFQTYFLSMLQDNAHSNGNITRYAPSPSAKSSCPPCWNQAYINAIYSSWKESGLVSVMEAHYETMKGLADFYKRNMENHIWTSQTYGDWASPNGLTRPSEGGAYYSTAAIYRTLIELAEMANALGKTADAQAYLAEAKAIYDAFNETFYNKEKGYYETGYWDETASTNNRTEYRQAVNLVPLYYGLCPAEYHRSVLESVIQDIQAKDYHLDTGCVGTEIIMPLLSREGYGDIAMKILMQNTYPSWGYWLEMGATSCWEKWTEGRRSDGHYFLGTYDEWFYQNLAGIQNMADGYKTVTVRPEVYSSLSYINSSVKTVRGVLGSNWQVNGNSTTLTITVPVGTTADILLPCASLNNVTVNGKTVTEQAGVLVTGARDGRALVQAGSGVYVFEISDNACPHCNDEEPASGWTQWDQSNVPSGTLTSGHYVLGSDVQLAGELTVAAGTTVVVDLNGHTLTAADGKRIFYVSGDLILLDTTADSAGTILCKDISDGTTGGEDGSTKYRGACAYIASGGDVTVYGGNITGGKAHRGGAFFVGGTASDPGQLTVYGGNIYGNIGTNRGHNIFVAQDASLYVYGGQIYSEASTTGARANIAIYRGKAYVYNGTIVAKGNQNLYVGGSAGVQNGELYVFGGAISGDKSSWSITTGSSVVAVYNGRISGQDPTAFAAACTCITQTNDTYTVFHTRGTGTCDICSVNDVTDMHAYTLVKEHDYSEDPLVCGTCGHIRATLDLTTVVLRPGAAGLYFKGDLNWDESDPEILACGIAVSTENPLPVADDTDSSSLYTQGGVSVLVKDILKTDNSKKENLRNARMTIYARAYVKLADGTYVYSETVDVCLQQVVIAAQSRWDTLSAVQKDALQQLYAAYPDVMSTWNIPNLKAA